MVIAGKVVARLAVGSKWATNKKNTRKNQVKTVDTNR
jgi:hypothetical protein